MATFFVKLTREQPWRLYRSARTPSKNPLDFGLREDDEEEC